jgi:serine protease Do
MFRHTSLRGALTVLAMLGLAAPAARPALAAEESADKTPWLGVYTQTVDDELREAMDLTGEGALVSGVVDDGPADRAGLRKGDVVVRFGSRPVESSEALTRLVRDSRVGENVTVEVRRGESTRTFTVRLGERSESSDRIVRRETLRERTRDGRTPRPRVRVFRGEPGEDFDIEIPDLKNLRDLRGYSWSGPGRMFTMGAGRGRLGVQIQDMNEQLGEYFQAPGGRGALISRVVEGSPAEKAGLKAGDVIVRVDGKSVDDSGDLIDALRDKQGAVRIEYLRRGETRSAEATLEKPERRTLRWQEDDSDLPPTPATPRAPRAPRAPGLEREDASELRQELDRLRQELERLRQELEESRR